MGYQLEVRPKGVKQDLDLMSLGVGVSQVLPTIVMALLAPEDSVLIFEQPEVHLHPKKPSENSGFHPFCEEKSPDSSTSHPMKNARRTDRLDDP